MSQWMFISPLRKAALEDIRWGVMHAFTNTFFHIPKLFPKRLRTFWHSCKWWITALHVEASVTRITKEHVILKKGGREGQFCIALGTHRCQEHNLINLIDIEEGDGLPKYEAAVFALSLRKKCCFLGSLDKVLVSLLPRTFSKQK